MTKIFGIVNLTTDSFSGDGTFDIVIIKDYIEQAAKNNIYGIDIGAFSTKPNGEFVSEKDELQRLSILPQIINFAHNLGLVVSLDSFRPNVAQFGLQNGIDYINDVNGFVDEKMINLALEYPNVKCICMHSLEAPVGSKKIDKSIDICNFIIDWANNKTDYLIAKGINNNRIIIDIGLGFGKDTEQCWNLLDNFTKLKQQIKCKIYVGHSRKGFLKSTTNSIADKDAATSAVSQKLIDLNCDYLRIHKIS